MLGGGITIAIGLLLPFTQGDTGIVVARGMPFPYVERFFSGVTYQYESFMVKPFMFVLDIVIVTSALTLLLAAVRGVRKAF